MTSVELQNKDRNKKAVAAAERLVNRARKAAIAGRLAQAATQYRKAIEMAEPTLGQRCGIGMARLATIYEDCAIVSWRHHYLDGERDDALRDVGTASMRKAVNYFAQCVGNLKHDGSLDAAWSQVFRLHNLSLRLVNDGVFFEGEHFARRMIALVDDMVDNGFPLNRYIWLRGRVLLARALVGQSLVGAACACIDEALQAKVASNKDSDSPDSSGSSDNKSSIREAFEELEKLRVSLNQ